MSEFDFQIEDDLEVGENYQNVKSTVAVPAPGNYRVRSTKTVTPRLKQDGTPVLWKGKYPVLSMSTVEITEPSENGRKVVVFQDIPTMPIQNPERGLVSEAADVLRAFDATATAANTGDVIRQATERLNAQEEFKIRLDYKAYDKEYAKKLVAALPAGSDSKAINAAYRKAEIRGYRKILKSNTESGKSQLGIKQWLSPAGNIVDVQPFVSRYYPSNENVQLGPDKNLPK